VSDLLRVVVPLTTEGWDERKQEFVEPKTQVLQLEHSLVSLSKWESKWCKPFLSKGLQTTEEILDYIKFMTLTQNVNPEVYNHITQDIVDEITAYINAPMTATTINDERNDKGRGEIVTAELIYYWMISLNIPFECQKWHLNRLLTLVRVCNVKNSPPKKRSKKELMRRNTAMNALRKQQLNTKG
jgi:hypothetical protein